MYSKVVINATTFTSDDCHHHWPQVCTYVVVENVGAMIHCTSCGLTCSEASVFHHVESDVLH